MKRIVLVFGLIIGIVMSSMISLSLLVEGISFEKSEIFGFTVIILAFSSIFVAVKNYRDKINKGVISFGKALSIGLLISLVATFVYVTVWMILFETVAADFMDKYSEHYIEKLENSDMPKAEMELKIAGFKESSEQYKNSPLIRIVATMIEVLPIGILISLISALILMKKKKEDDEGILD